MRGFLRKWPQPLLFVNSSLKIAALQPDVDLMQQLELFPWHSLAAGELLKIAQEIRNCYWFIRNSRDDLPGLAARRRAYRQVEAKKKRLQLAGVSKTELLYFLKCCRAGCQFQRAKKCLHCVG